MLFMFLSRVVSCNLISVSKLTHDSKCVAKFLSVSCQFQDPLSERMIGCARLHDGLYFLEHSSSSSRQSLVFSVKSSSISNFQEIILQHFRLSHPIFLIKLGCFLHYFNIIKISVYSLWIFWTCQACSCLFSPNKPYKPSAPFTRIHSDIWTPSQIHNSTGKEWLKNFHWRSHKSYLGYLLQNLIHQLFLKKFTT